MHIKKSLPRDKFTKISNLIFSDPMLSDGAKVLYGFLASMPNGKTIVDGYILKALKVSQPVLTRRKKELKDSGLIMMVQLAPRVHDLYIGFPGCSALMVKNAWDTSDE
jgi:hypothetical protein|tara:strand:+ start:942 stop:1265 length:324 start_codon:yes stop_codon:yes gene_type:complete